MFSTLLKTRAAHRSKLFWPSVLIALSALSFDAAAQSGRILPTPSPTPEAAPAEPVEEAKPKFIPDPNRDRYKLIFTTELEVKFVTNKKNKESIDHEATNLAYSESFVAELNRAGEQGYKLLSVFNERMAVVERADAQYEYAWFETKSSYHFIKEGFENEFEKLSGKGFRLAYRSLVFKNCYSEPDASPGIETCEYRDFFLFEREKGVEEPRQVRYVYGLPRWRPSKVAGDITAIVKDVGWNYYPVAFVSEFALVLEKLPDGDPRLSRQRDMQIVRAASFWGKDNLPKKVEEMARLGYRLELVDNQIAVMYREESSAKLVSYVWLSAGDKKGKLEKELAGLEASGAVFRAAYADYWGVERTLIFERGPAADGKRREYRALTLIIEQTNKPPKKSPPVRVRKFDLTPQSKETWAELNRLVKEGFVVRALFLAGEIRVLLERTQ